MVTSTSTPGSIDMLVIDLTVSAGPAASVDAAIRPRTGQVDQALVDLELVAVPGLGALTAGLYTSAWADERATNRLARRDGQALGREANRALDAQVLVLRAVDEVGAD